MPSTLAIAWITLVHDPACMGKAPGYAIMPSTFAVFTKKAENCPIKISF